MRTKTLLFFILFFNSILAQNPASRIFYLDSLWNETQEGNHKYYRIIEDYYTDKPLHKVTDYYKNSVLQMEGLTSSLDRIIKEGTFIFYYENGNKQVIADYKENRLTGKEYRWYKNGNKESEGEYTLSNDKLEPSSFTLNQFWDETGEQRSLMEMGI